MSESRLKVMAYAGGIASVILATFLVTLTVVLGTDASYTSSQSLWSGLPDVLMAFVYALVGTIVILKRPTNLVGWALALAGIGSLLGGCLDAYAEVAVLAKPGAGLPGGLAAAGALGRRVDTADGRRVPAARHVPLGHSLLAADAPLHDLRPARLHRRVGNDLDVAGRASRPTRGV